MNAPAQPGAQAKPIRDWAYRLVYFATGLPMYLEGGLTVYGQEHVPREGRAIIAGNHVTGLDPFVIAHALPNGRRIQYMAKKELFGVPLIGGLIDAGGSFGVDRSGNDVSAIRTALRILQAGRLLGIFPEGTRGGKELHGGVALLALRGAAPVVPAYVWHARRRWHVRFGPPLAPAGGVKELTERVGERIEGLSLSSH